MYLHNLYVFIFMMQNIDAECQKILFFCVKKKKRLGRIFQKKLKKFRFLIESVYCLYIHVGFIHICIGIYHIEIGFPLSK